MNFSSPPRAATFLGASCLRAAAFAFVMLAVPVSAHAQPADAHDPVMTQSATESFDTVHLRNGGLYRGRLTEIVPEDHVTMILESGEKKRLAWTEIAKIVTSTMPAGAAPAPPPVATPVPTTPPPALPPPVASPPDATLPPPPEGPPRTQWRANRPLLVAGAIMFASGYGPDAIAGLPSTIGLVGRVVILVLTVGLPCLFNSSGDYLCSGQHGAVQLMIPFVGPFTFASDHPRDSIINKRGAPLSDTTRAFLYTSAGLQIAGVLSIVGSVVFGKNEPVPRRKALSFDLPLSPNKGDGAPGPALFVAPMSEPNAVGITVGAHRW